MEVYFRLLSIHNFCFRARLPVKYVTVKTTYNYLIMTFLRLNYVMNIFIIFCNYEYSLFNDCKKKETNLQLQENQISLQCSLNSHPLWVFTFYISVINAPARIFI